MLDHGSISRDARESEAPAASIAGGEAASPRGAGAAMPAVLLVGKWRVDTASRSVTDGTTMARLSPRAVRLLQQLASVPGEALSRQRLLDAVWPDVIVSDESLTQTVTELRRVLGDRHASSTIIETIPKYGYRLALLPESAAGDEPASPQAASDGFDLRAYQLCLDARNALLRGGMAAISLPELLTAEAVAMAPDFALAHAEHAIALTYRWLYQRNHPDGLERALVHAERATRLRPDMAIGHAAMAFAFGALGRTDRMRRALEQGLSRDMTDAELHMLGTRALFAARDYACATAMAERAAALNTEDFRPLYFAARAASLFDPDRAQRNARACLARIQARLALDPTEPRALNTLGPIYTLLGWPDDAVAAVEAQGGEESPCVFYDAIAYSAVGDWERATERFEAVVEQGWRHGDWLMAEPSLARFRDHPRFRRAARSIGLG